MSCKSGLWSGEREVTAFIHSFPAWGLGRLHQVDPPGPLRVGGQCSWAGWHMERQKMETWSAPVTMSMSMSLLLSSAGGTMAVSTRVLHTSACVQHRC